MIFDGGWEMMVDVTVSKNLSANHYYTGLCQQSGNVAMPSRI